MAWKDGNESDGKRRRLALPKFGRKQKDDSEGTGGKAGFGIGAGGNPNDPFGDAFDIDIKDGIGPIPSEKEMRKNKKGKSSLSLGAKYGGQRKWFGLLALALIFALASGILNLMLLGGKVGKGELDAEVSKAVANETAKTFPVGEAGMWVESFVRVYGTWDYKTPGARAADLSPYLAPGLDEQAGWNGQGTQRLIYSAVSSQPQIIDRQRAMFDVTYQIQDGTWRCAKVPVFAYKPSDAKEGPLNQWGFAVTANPTPVPCALRVGVPQFAENKFAKTDTNAADTLRDSFFPGFFTAWIASDSDTLRQYMAPDVKTFGLGGAYQSNPEITEVIIPLNGDEDTVIPKTVYTAYVTVTLTDFANSKLEVTYKVPVASTGSQWQVMGEPEAIVQDLKKSADSKLPDSDGKDTTKPEENNEYSEPDQKQPAQPGAQSPTVPGDGASSAPADAGTENP